MKKLLFITVVLSLSCKTIRTQKIRTTVNDLGIELSFSDRVNESYMQSVDSVLDAVIHSFNKEEHAYRFHRKKAADTEYVTFHFTEGKKITPKQKKAGYILSAAGLIVIPASMVAANVGFVVGFYYFPQNKLNAKISLSPVMTDSVYAYKKLSVQTGALFKPADEQVQKLFVKLRSGLYKNFLQISEKLSKEKNRGM